MILKKSQVLIACIIAAILSLIVVIIYPGEMLLFTWIKFFFFSSLLILLLYESTKALHINRSANRAVWVSFFIRIFLGIFLFAVLPIWGHNEDAPNAGYLYLDAFQRDNQAWALAQSGQPLAAAFQEDFYADQYGGLLAISAYLYRIISPDLHRPVVIILFCSFIATLGLPFLWKAVEKKWGSKVATLSVWILSLYPESVILGSSQMREPLIMGLTCIALWGIGLWGENRKRASLAMVTSVLSMAIISSRATIVIIAFLAIWFWLENIQPISSRHQKIIASICIFFAAAAGIAITTNWLIESARYDLFLMESSSGRIQTELDKVSGLWRVPFIVGYGFFQPVLPATLIYPSLALMQVISIYRAVGWYLLAPLILLLFFNYKKADSEKEHALVIWCLLFSIAWIFISSFRAGGDQWDSVRYRTIALPIMAILASLAWFRQKESPSRWFGRIIILEVFFILVFLQWYISRYIEIWERLPFWQMILLLITCSAIFIMSCVMYDTFKHENIT